MSMRVLRSLRTVGLVLLCGSAVVVLGRVMLAPASQYVPATSYEFPDVVPGSDGSGSDGHWQATASSATLPDVDFLMAAAQYDYRQGDRSLKADAWYLTSTDGDVATLLAAHSPQLADLTLQPYQDGDNVYAIAQDPSQDRLYLTACIAVNGDSTVTAEQFQDTRRLSRLSAVQILEWLMGQRRIEDYRCLWTLLSIPTSPTTQPQDQAMLQAAWQSWHRWWAVHYPVR
ncbi:cyanoexosortase A system-associated protein [Leptolyngbya sp. CCY15150]|uniref:cyanoexosortase A system-associated protein n=1 Tax=Leptolyngbya sp. CCY15150 TaxID=2767772 RepID=UPI0019522464|nr:cyanoexosortase A system-associated protein [Leptolyngbya sp. CCY15150]